MAFFPCIYFTGFTNPCYYTLGNENYRNLTDEEKFSAILERAEKRNLFYKILYKMVGVCIFRRLRIIIENPFSQLHFLHGNFLSEPSYIDKDRTRRGDYFKKPTGYWYFNCEPTRGFTWQRTPENMKKRVRDSKGATQTGVCSEERSMISPDYARNFICDNILGITQRNIDKQTSIFDFLTE